jgi:flagellar motility protein MotE (MotC chaperone)
MKVNLFSPILVMLIITLIVKASMLFGRIEEQANYEFDTSVTSILIDTAYAKDEKNNLKSLDSKVIEDNFSDLGKVKPHTKDLEKIANNAPSLSNGEQLQEFTNMSGSELKLLKELSKRRQELEKNQDDFEVKQQVLKATENKIDQKMNELRILQGQLEEVMKQYDQKEQGKILSLVKIYENMKPRDAAKIFDELEMPVLLQVVSNMKEVKVAPIIASMNPLKARDLSNELAKQKSISN